MLTSLDEGRRLTPPQGRVNWLAVSLANGLVWVGRAVMAALVMLHCTSAGALAGCRTTAEPAEIVVDAWSLRILHADRADELRHPASLTKVMTLYLLFEQLEAGTLRLNSKLPVSEHAS